MERQNRTARPICQLTAVVASMFRKEGSLALDPADLLPFPTPRKYLSEAESLAFLDRFSGSMNGN